MAHDLFISYSSKDKPTADAMCARLEAHGIRCWIAPRDVFPSLPYGEAIIQAIHASRLMVLIFSDHSNRSQQVMREVERAVSQGIPILPFRIEDVPLTPSMEYFISAPHWLDAMNGPLEEHLERLAATAQRILSQEEPAPQRQATPPPLQTPPSPISPSAPPASSGFPTESVRTPAPQNRLIGALALVALLLLGAWGIFRVSSNRSSGRPYESSAVQPVGGASPQQESETPAPAPKSVPPPRINAPSEEKPATASGKLQGKIGEELSDGEWGFQVSGCQSVPSYTMKRTTETDYALYRATADLADSDFSPKPGNTLLVFQCRISNGAKEKRSLWHYDTDTAVWTHQGESYTPIAYDMRGGPIQSEPLLPQAHQDFAVLFAVPEGAKPKELVFVVKTIDDKDGTELHVAL